MMEVSEMRELEDLLQGWCNHTLTDQQCSRLEEILANDAEARRVYRRYRNLEAALHERCDGAVLEEDPSNLARSRWSQKSWWGLAASGVVLATAAWFVWPERPAVSSAPALVGANSAEQFAVLTEAVDLVWRDSEGMPHPGGTFDLGEIDIESGLAHVDFFCGANVVIEGPAKLEFTSSMRGILHHGKLRARVPEQARGFSIVTAQAKIVDLGTEFGLLCDPSGRHAEVHVFDGEVEVHDLSDGARPSQLVTSGSALKLPSSAAWEAMVSDEERFVDVSEVADLAEVNELDRSHAWLAEHDEILAHPDLVAYYDFESSASSGRSCILSDRGPNQLHGAIVGCSWSEGRWRGKGALEFKQSGDRVRLHIPGSFDSLTMMAWVRMDGFDKDFSSLLLSDRFDDGHAHWQIRSSGKIDFGIKHRGKEREIYLTEPVLGHCDLGRWVHLAVVYDGPGNVVNHYVDGELAGLICVDGQPKKLQLGPCEIGNWNPVEKRINGPVRNFNGRMDEFTLLRTALESKDIERWYSIGRP